MKNLVRGVKVVQHLEDQWRMFFCWKVGILRWKRDVCKYFGIFCWFFKDILWGNGKGYVRHSIKTEMLEILWWRSVCRCLVCSCYLSPYPFHTPHSTLLPHTIYLDFSLSQSPGFNLQSKVYNWRKKFYSHRITEVRCCFGEVESVFNNYPSDNYKLPSCKSQLEG